jgi:hypothetical protein
MGDTLPTGDQSVAIWQKSTTWLCISVAKRADFDVWSKSLRFQLNLKQGIGLR